VVQFSKSRNIFRFLLLFLFQCLPISMSTFLAVVLWDMVLCRGLSLCLGLVLLVSFCFILGLGVQFCSGSCWPFLAQFCSLSSGRLTCLWEYTLSYSAWLIVEGKRKKKACSAWLSYSVLTEEHPCNQINILLGFSYFYLRYSNGREDFCSSEMLTKPLKGIELQE